MSCGPVGALVVGVRVGLGVGEGLDVGVKVGVSVGSGVKVEVWVTVAVGEGIVVGGMAVGIGGARLGLGLAVEVAAGAVPWQADRKEARISRLIR